MTGYRDRVQPTVASHFPSLSNEPDNNLIHMFTEDISLEIMPNWRSYNETESVFCHHKWR